MILADLHVHTTFSDGKLTIPQVIDFYGKNGFGAIAITDHICEDRTFLGVAAGYLQYTLTSHTFENYLKIISEESLRAWESYEMIVIPGFEISKNSWSNHRSAHILGLGIKEFVSADLGISEISRRIRGQGGIAIAAHPVSTRRFEPQTFHLWSRRHELRECFDAWEVASGPHLFPEVVESDLPKIATSDFHRPENINSWKTVLHCEKSRESILAAIVDQDLSFQFYTLNSENHTLVNRGQNFRQSTQIIPSRQSQL